MLKKIQQGLFRKKIRYSARLSASRHKDALKAVEKYVVFLGYPRSGHSLVGSLMDAHPDMVIAHELNALKYLEEGYRQEELFGLILHNTEAYAKNDRKWETFTYGVEGQWQGRYRSLKVIGDKKGGRTTFSLMGNPDRLQLMRNVIQLPIFYIHITRNPFDNIARMFLKDRERFARVFPAESLQDMANVYFRYSDTIQEACRSIEPGQLLEMQHEEFTSDPRNSVSKLCGFLGLEADQSYLNACAELIYDSPNKSRHAVEWPDALKEEV